MKKAFIIISLLVLSVCRGFGAERVYVSTDRNAYITGERVWCSVFCFGNDGTLSRSSAVAYLELISESGSAIQTKIGLVNGRGSGEFFLPASLKEGNYRLIAYTSSQNPESFLDGSRIISVYNTFTKAREESVKVSELAPTASMPDISDGITLSVRAHVSKNGEVNVNLVSDCADVSLSVYHQDDLFQLTPEDIGSFMGVFPVTEDDFYGEPEITGEIIRAVANGAGGTQAAILSCAGSVDDTYISTTKDDGSVEFHTGNIYGDREMVCEVPEGGADVRLQILSPFKKPAPGKLPSLVIGRNLFSSLVRRKASLTHQVKADTLVEFLQRREDPVFSGVTWERYNLDDYNRFPTVREVIVEILPSLKVRRFQGKPVFAIMVTNQNDSRRVSRDHVLAMMDGVVITSPDLILSFDAMLLQEVMICRQPVVFGNTLYTGVVNFVTKNNYVTALRFAPNVRVVDFSGVRYPVAYLGEKPEESAQDLRELLYWHPSLKVNGVTSVPVFTPSYEGKFRVVAEGIGKDGKPVRATASFEVR